MACSQATEDKKRSWMCCHSSVILALVVRCKVKMAEASGSFWDREPGVHSVAETRKTLP